MKKYLSTLFLLVIPTIFIYFGLNFNRGMYGGDPEYAYLLNGLLIDEGKYVGHIDNPGTPVQIYSSIMLAVSDFFIGDKNESIETNVLKNPDPYLEIQRNGFVILNGILFFLMGLLIFYHSGIIWLALILQLSPFLSSNLIEHAWTRTSPEPMLILATGIMIFALIKYYYSRTKSWKYYPIIFSLISGLGLATKATFFPIVLIPLFIFFNKKEIKKYLLWIIPSFIFFTLPALPLYPNMAGWFFRLAFHTGTYGHGKSGLIDFSQYGTDFFNILKNNIQLGISIGLFFVFIFIEILNGKFKQTFKQSLSFRLFFSIGIAILSGVFFVAKHYHANHYLIPVNSIIGIFAVTLIWYLNEKYNLIASLKFLPLILTMTFVFSAFLNIPSLKTANWGYIITDDEYIEVNDRLNNEYKDYTKFYFYPVALNKYSALRWGNIYSRQKFTPALEKLYPEGLFYNYQKDKFEFWETQLLPNEILNSYGNKLILTGMPLSSEQKDNLKTNGIILNNIYEGRVQAIYTINVNKSAFFKQKNLNTLRTILFDPDSISTDEMTIRDGKYSVASNYQISEDFSFNSNKSSKLSGENQFAFTFELDSLDKNQEYIISVWCKGNRSGKTVIVASSLNSDIFYINSSEIIDRDDDGWEKYN
ncbi:MAG: hypothetical protein R2771_04140 [Saprospiraceae bacterium]